MTDRRRVLIVGPVPAHEGGTSTGGIATHVVELARALNERGWQTAVYADNTPTALAPTAAEWGSLHSPVPLSRSPRGLRALIARDALAVALRTRSEWGPARDLGKKLGPTVSQVLGLARAAEDVRPDVVHYHQPDFRPLYGRIARLDRLPEVTTLHSLSAFAPDAPAALSALVLDNLRRADRVVAVSDDVRDGLARIAPDVAPALVPNGVDLALYRAGTRVPRDAARPPAILFVGRVTEDKGVVDLLAAHTALQRDFPGATLTLVGPEIGFDRDAALATTGAPRDLVRFLGSLPPRSIAKELAAADVFAMPSRLREGQPRVLIEAMAAGVPIVATDVGAIPGMLAEGTGLVVPPADPAGLATAIGRVLAEPELAASLAYTAAGRAEGYDIRTVAERIEAVYTSLL